MKSRFLLLFVLIAVSPFLSAQKSTENFAYAITSETKGGFEWREVKKINLATGEVLANIFESSKGEYNLFNARNAKKLTPGNSSENNNKRPFAGLSAACAFDRRSNRLYYVPMFINELRYIDLNTKTPSIYIFEDELFSKASDLELEQNHMTRMVIGADGNGYALNNDGSHLVRFTTGQHHEIKDLGRIRDAASNDTVYIKDPNTSWGGDLIADASGKLYLITEHNHVFRIDINAMTATYIARIKNLPGGFTTNGAVVNAEGDIVLSSANFMTTYYLVNPKSWEASAIERDDQVYNTSDLANQYLLNSEKKEEPISPPVTVQKMGIYPNPVRSNAFTVSFGNGDPGRYNLQMVDIMGRMVSNNYVEISSAGQVSEVKVNPSLARGMYVVKVLNHEKKEVFLKKIILQ